MIGQGHGAGTGAIPATVTNVTATQITATTGGGARTGTYDLFVIAPDHSVSQPVSGDQFTYTPVRASISSVAPDSGPSAGGTPITITGTGFSAGDQVVIAQGHGAGTGAIPATVTNVTATQITATTGGGARTGTYNLFVIAPDHSVSQPVSGDQFTYTR